MLVRRIPRIDPAPSASLFERGERLDPTEVDSIVVLVWSAPYLGLGLTEHLNLQAPPIGKDW